MEYSKTIVERLLDKAVAHRKEVMLTVALALVGGMGTAGYFFYKEYVAKQAHKAYATALQLQQARVLKKDETPGIFETTFPTSLEKWQAVEDAFGGVYKEYNHVGIGVMAGAAQVQALMRLGRYEEARTLLSDVLARITSPELRALYSLTYARLLMDSTVEGDEAKGVSLLSQLAATKDSAVHDSALYYLGMHYWHARDTAAASNYWKQLVMQYEGLDKKSSPWVGKAKEKLSLLDDISDQ